MTRIEEIELKIKGLVEEKETLLKIEKKNKAELSFDTQFKKYQQTYTGKQVLESYKFEDDGFWKIRGEDPNCDMGGYHHMPELGIFNGTFREALMFAFNHPQFYAWGGGGDITKVEIIKPN